MADDVATAHKTVAVYVNSTYGNVNGSRDRSSPAALFINVCLTMNFLKSMYPESGFINDNKLRGPAD